MFHNILKCLVLLSPLALTPIQAFWWRSTTTEAPPPAMKQIPLTYFRTYTYQPMAANPLPFPLMSSTDYISNYAALANNPYFNPMMSMLPQTMAAGAGTGGAAGTETGLASNEITPQMGGMRPAKSYAGVNVVRSLNSGHKGTSSSTSSTTTTTPKPTTASTSTTTTTTTTTTPVPTTTTTAKITTTTMESPSTLNDASTGPLIKADAMVNIEAAYPAFNRKVYTNHFNINYNRPVYPYPEYSLYKPLNSPGNSLNDDIKSTSSSSNPSPSSSQNVEFVPCMCPVNIQGGYASGIPITGNPSNSIFLAQSRTNADVEASMELPATTDVADSPNSDVLQADSSLTQFVEDLQMVNMDGEDEDVTANAAVTS